MSTPHSHRAPTRGDAADRTTIVLRPVGSPLPLGFFAFAVGLTMTALLDLRVLPVHDGHQVATLLLAFTAPLELAAGVIAYLARDGAAGTVFGVLGSSWVVTGLGMLGSPAGARSPVQAAFDILVAITLLLLSTAAFSAKPALAVVLVASSSRFLLNGLEQALGGTVLREAAGAVGLLIALLSLYAGLATVLEDGRGVSVLPTGRRARASVAAGLGADLASLGSEAGVRNQL